MATIYLVRHGRAAASFDSHLDPGLDAVGREQATAVADALEHLGPLPIFTSPLARARETARPLSERWGSEPVIEPGVAEIPSPAADPAERGVWLRGVMGKRWDELDEDLHAWRTAMIDCVEGFQKDCVVFCHFIAINVVVGAATDADELISFRPANGSISKVAVDAGGLRLIALGAEADTRVG